MNTLMQPGEEPKAPKPEHFANTPQGKWAPNLGGVAFGAEGLNFPIQGVEPSILNDIEKLFPSVKKTDNQFNLFSGRLASDKAVDILVTGLPAPEGPSFRGGGEKATRLLIVEGNREEEDAKLRKRIGASVLPKSVSIPDSENVSVYVLARGARRIVRTLANSPYSDAYSDKLHRRALELAHRASLAAGRDIDIEQIGSYANGGDVSADDVDFFVVPTAL